jgi:hypothetical protein
MKIRNILNNILNPNAFDQGLLARYPNKLKLVDTKIPDQNGNTQMIMTEDGNLISQEKFSGVVYVNESTFEVFSGIRHEKIGVFEIGSKTNWEIETPRQIVNKSHLDFKNKLDEKINEIKPNCACFFPRVTNYLTRNSTESTYISGVLKHNFLIFNTSIYDSETEIETTFYNCKVCDSEYVWKYKERGIDELKLLKNKAINKIGKEIATQAPNFIDAKFDKVYCRQSYLFRDHLFESDLNGIINYLFDK